MHKLSAVVVAVVLGVTRPAFAADQLVEPHQLDEIVTVEDVMTDGPSISGRLVNHTGSTLEDLTLRESDLFLWRNERHPGPDDDDPSRTQEHVVRGPIPPHSSLPFRFERDPLPRRTDGAFMTIVRVIGLTRRDQPVAPPAD